MKAVLDSMLWVSYVTHRNGPRYRVIERACKGKVRLFVSEYILDEVVATLRKDMGESARFARLARAAVLRRAKLVVLPRRVAAYVPGDPKDDAVVQTAITSKSDYLVTADGVLLELGKVRNVEIVTVKTFAQRLPAPT
jgi:putative PIN family toxin of toxin-antitoxin system